MFAGIESKPYLLGEKTRLWKPDRCPWLGSTLRMAKVHHCRDISCGYLCCVGVVARNRGAVRTETEELMSGLSLMRLCQSKVE